MRLLLRFDERSACDRLLVRDREGIRPQNKASAERSGISPVTVFLNAKCRRMHHPLHQATIGLRSVRANLVHLLAAGQRLKLKLPYNLDAPFV